MPSVRAYYRHLRSVRGAGRLAATQWAFGYLLAVVLLRLEGPAWQSVLADRQRLYPHLAGKAPSLGDPLRVLLQTLWLLLARPPRPCDVAVDAPAQRWLRWPAVLRTGWRRGGALARGLAPAPLPLLERSGAWTDRLLDSLSPSARLALQGLLATVATLLALLCVTEPFSYGAQVIFVLLLWGLALAVRRLPGRFAVLMLIVLSAIVSCRYIWWRYSATLKWDSSFDLICGLVLLAAETYSWVVLILGYVQTCWPLNRQPAQLPTSPTQWPSVDLLIPTYNEDLSVVRTTVLAALGLDWPADRLRIYLCDDGRREQFRQFADEVGIGYITRPDNRHAKAGNLNHALTVTSGELIAIFDCDHVPVRSFLQVTAGWFVRDPKMALVQTPHHFFSPDPFERNLGSFRHKPNEGELFYGLVQNGNDMWNAAFFCGSCAVLRRTAVESIGGFAVETVTEDAHTALRLHRAGWNSAYLRTPQAAGLATESLSAHIGQRIRWARGMAQIFRTDNPLLGKGLTIFQRLCYANAMLHFLVGLPRLIYLTAPLAFLLLHAYIIYAPALLIVLYVLPHMIHASLTNARLQGKHRHSFWGEVYETVLAWYIARPTTVALFNPGKGKFNVTAKGGLMDENQFDWHIARPYLLLALLNVLGLGFAAWRIVFGPAAEIATVLVSTLWVLYNLLIIGTAVAVAAEVRQVRRSHRVLTQLPASLRIPSGHVHPCTLSDFSDSGAGLELPLPLPLAPEDRVQLLLRRGEREFSFPARVTRLSGKHLGLRLEDLDLAQQIDFVQCTFARADVWLNRHDQFEADRPLRSFIEVLRLGGRGYYRLLEYISAGFGKPLRPLFRLAAWLLSYLPRTPAARPLEYRT